MPRILKCVKIGAISQDDFGRQPENDSQGKKQNASHRSVSPLTGGLWIGVAAAPRAPIICRVTDGIVPLHQAAARFCGDTGLAQSGDSCGISELVLGFSSPLNARLFTGLA